MEQMEIGQTMDQKVGRTGSIDQDWEKSRQNEVIKRLDAREDLQTIMESFPEFKEVFQGVLDTIDCSDGRVLGGKKIGIAGSGMLLPEADRAKFVALYKNKVKEVTAHADCGAAAKKFATLKPEEIPAGVATADEYGIYCAKKMAEDLAAKYRFLDRSEMANEYHNEPVLVLDQTAKFDSTNLKNFPPHFVCTGAGLGFSDDYMKGEITTLAGIAFGHHGFGAERFSAQNPFYIIVAADNSDELAHWSAVASEAVAEFGDKAVVKGFLKPESQEHPELN